MFFNAKFVGICIFILLLAVESPEKVKKGNEPTGLPDTLWTQ